MSETPIIDNASYGWYPIGTNDIEMVDAETARRLERDRAELIAALRDLRAAEIYDDDEPRLVQARQIVDALLARLGEGK